MAEDEFSIGNADVRNFTFHLMKANNELFNEEEAKKSSKLARVKRKCTKKNGEEWHFILDDEVILILKENRFTLAEREFLRSADGMNFLLNSCKLEIKSVSKIKDKLKEILK